MNTQLIHIGNTDLPVVEFYGQRVITLAMVDQAHQRPVGTARRNFNTYKEKLIENEDYFVRNTYEAKSEFGITAPNGLTLLTESGYLMVVKVFEDDLAWQVQRDLVNGYFKAKTGGVSQQSFISLQERLHHAQQQVIGLLEEKVSRLEIRVPRKHQADEITAALRCRQEGFSYRDIGELLNRSKESVNHMVRRAEGRS
jgi:hypothetical protein